jgi:FtsZ-interacting cell division protein ZipA
MPELRWILLGFSIVVLAAIYLWGRRSSRSVPSEDALVRVRPEPAMHTLDEMPANPYASPFDPVSDETYDVDAHAGLEDEAPTDIEPSPQQEAVDESAFIRTATLAKFTANDTWRGRIEPTFGDPEQTAEIPSPEARTERSARFVSPAPDVKADVEEANEQRSESESIAPTLSSGDAPVPKRVEKRKILSLRLAASPHRIEGGRLLEVMLAEELQHGKYGIFHRVHQDGTSIFSVASMVEPGSFDPDAMQSIQYPGVTLFAQLPASVPGMHALNELIACARRLQQSLGGTLQDDRGIPLTVHRIEKLRQDVRDFERSANSPRPTLR